MVFILDTSWPAYGFGYKKKTSEILISKSLVNHPRTLKSSEPTIAFLFKKQIVLETQKVEFIKGWQIPTLWYQPNYK